MLPDSLEVVVRVLVEMVRLLLVVKMRQPFHHTEMVEDPLHLSVENLLQDVGWLVRLVSDLVDIYGRLLFAVV